jgi:hypothetical protein
MIIQGRFTRFPLRRNFNLNNPLLLPVFLQVSWAHLKKNGKTKQSTEQCKSRCKEESR